jgi:hypothetical protein
MHRSQRNSWTVGKTQVEPEADLKGTCCLDSPQSSAWDVSVFEGISFQEMLSLNEHLRFRRDFHPLLVCGIEAVSHEGDEISLASTAVSEEGDEISTAILESLREDDAMLQISPSHKAVSDTDGVNDVSSVLLTWEVDAKRLRTRDQQIVSPTFDISPQMSCRLMLRPTSMGDKKRQTTFLKSSGCGSIEFKLVDIAGPAPHLDLNASVGKGARKQRLPGTVKHDFDWSSVCRLGDEWDFRSAIDVESSSFVVCVEVFV